ncbi:hypothetical protein F8388_013611 [Cannabis sativa]|uniref:Peptidase A1 domain-containing protein n=2 Tax=Cannabis sativa TaxID=3483 RepID=A0A7J6DX39_CANSA|nr:hypothetical protein F8388_013611 [Cannabis sativa]KAF4378860.1 hypothetical protein G4B88_008330 [Cannabis sativa]
MASLSSPTILLFSFFLISILVSLSNATTAKTVPFPKALVLRVTKDTKTLQYITQITQRTPAVQAKVVLDVGGEFLWVDCEKGYKSSTKKSVPCGSPQCLLSLSGACSSNGKSTESICSVTPTNPFSVSTSGDLFTDIFYIQSTNGFNPGKSVSVPNLPFVCAPNSLLKGLASGTVGMVGLGRNKVALPSLLSSAFNFPRKFGICLSGHSNGVVFFGKEPLVLHDVHVTDPTSLIYTPLIRNPRSLVTTSQGNPSTEYFIGLKSINIEDKPVKFNTTLLTFKNENGHGGTKISTIDPYTTLETSIYKAVVAAYIKAVKIPTVKAVAPFGACYNAKSIGFTWIGPNVPRIDLVLTNDKVWSIIGPNLMVNVGNDVLCLGLVDGGPLHFVDWGVKFTPTAVVIGGFQIENNFLLFDLGASRLGFSKSLLPRQTECSNFNFTSV